ncbi:hypothetical protein FS749_009060 [Ceratobasidium sp. UAMH 11750]|nr:hypothetical protein FS749_009060 [Ceratobasidium sp. UAMH 11750]
METRQRKTGGEHLPPKREGKAVRDVHPPLHNVNLSTIIYALAGLGLLWAALSAYRVAQLKADAGGWYNLALGKRPDTGAPMKGNLGSHGTHDTSVKGIEDRIRALADELGIHPREFASAIRPLMPSASATSISAAASATPMADAVIGVLADEDRSGAGSPESVVSQAANLGGLGGIVGLDDPAPDLDG